MADAFPTGSVRIGSADRTLVAERLVAHYQAGQLGRQELELRLTQAAHAHTDDDLHQLTLDLPDVPGPAKIVPFSPRTVTPPEPVKEPASALRVAFDVIVLLLTASAAVCLVLLMLLVGINSHYNGSETLVAAALAAFGAFTVGAGGVHLLHRAFGKR